MGKLSRRAVSLLFRLWLHPGVNTLSAKSRRAASLNSPAAETPAMHKSCMPLFTTLVLVTSAPAPASPGLCDEWPLLILAAVKIARKLSTAAQASCQEPKGATSIASVMSCCSTASPSLCASNLSEENALASSRRVAAGCVGSSEDCGAGVHGLAAPAVAKALGRQAQSAAPACHISAAVQWREGHGAAAAEEALVCSPQSLVLVCLLSAMLASLGSLVRPSVSSSWRLITTVRID